MTPAQTILYGARLVQWRRRASDVYDESGNAVRGAETTTVIRATVQPAAGRQLKDLPEGIRSEVSAMAWTREMGAALDHEIIDGDTAYDVVHVMPRPADSFVKLALKRRDDG